MQNLAEIRDAIVALTPSRSDLADETRERCAMLRPEPAGRGRCAATPRASAP
jgi:hypothetical protein